MTWTMTGDDYPDRFLELSDAAYRLHHAATVHANRLSLDGRIVKTRLSLIPVPQRTRRPSIIAELLKAGHWVDDGDAWVLADFFDAQRSAEEVEANREWDRLRQRIRFAKGDVKAGLAVEERAAFAALNEARERRKALASQRRPHGVRAESRRPIPLHPIPAHPVPDEDEAGGQRRTASPPGAAASEAEECIRCAGRFAPLQRIVMTPNGPRHEDQGDCVLERVAP